MVALGLSRDFCRQSIFGKELSVFLENLGETGSPDLVELILTECAAREVVLIPETIPSSSLNLIYKYPSRFLNEKYVVVFKS